MTSRELLEAARHLASCPDATTEGNAHPVRVVALGQTWRFTSSNDVVVDATVAIVDGVACVVNTTGEPFAYGPDDVDIGSQWTLLDAPPAVSPPDAPKCLAPDWCGFWHDDEDPRRAVYCRTSGPINCVNAIVGDKTLGYCSPACRDARVAPLEAKAAATRCESFQTDGCDGGPYQQHSAECSRRCDVAAAAYKKAAQAPVAQKAKVAICIDCEQPHPTLAWRVLTKWSRLLMCDACYLAGERNDHGHDDPEGVKSILRDAKRPELLPRARLAVDWFEDLLPEAGR